MPTRSVRYITVTMTTYILGILIKWNKNKEMQEFKEQLF